MTRMKSPVTTVFALLFASNAWSQPFAIGTTSVALHDDVRDRDVPCSVYYPAVVAGADAAIATGTFTTLVFGHGFVMSVNAYTYLGEHFASAGYIVALPTTEGGFAPDHASFGQDLAFVSNALQALGADAGSPFNGHVAPASALMGHSMGGGAAMLGAAGNVNIQAVVLLAPAETTPSAIAAAGQIGVPTLIFGASEDCVTPIATNTQPMYDASTATCKAFVDILGGGHCYFGDSSPTCSLGEFTCGPDLTIDRQQQHQAVLDVADLWLERFLGGLSEAYTTLSDTLTNSTRFTSQFQCITTGAVSYQKDELFTVQWLQTMQALVLSGLEGGDRIDVSDVAGRSLAQARATSDRFVLKLPDGVDGILLVRLRRGDRSQVIHVPALL